MAEIRLICPGCTAEYRIPDTAIPADGREVECSACGNVWHVAAQLVRPSRLDAGARPPATPATGLPQLNRRLPDDVLNILRGEVEHERRARAAAAPAGPQPATPGRQALEPEWPATTITRQFIESPAELPLAAAPGTGQSLPAGGGAEGPANLPAVADKVPAPEARLPAPRIDTAIPAHRAARGGYAAGFGLAMSLAAACVALYLLAPAFSDQGPLGNAVAQFRIAADEARLWMQDRAVSLIR